MAWEKVIKKQSNFQMRPVAWTEVPCICINKSQIALNHKFMTSYGLKQGDMLELLIDREGYRIGFKKQDPDTDTPGFRVSGPKAPNQHARYINCKQAASAFPDRRGRVYRATLNPGERIIEVCLKDHE